MVGRYRYPSPHSERANRLWKDKKAGRLHISAQERRILFHLSRGDSVKDIAFVAQVKPDTIRAYINRLRLKLGLPSRFALGMWYASQLKDDDK